MEKARALLTLDHSARSAWATSSNASCRIGILSGSSKKPRPNSDNTFSRNEVARRRPSERETGRKPERRSVRPRVVSLPFHPALTLIRSELEQRWKLRRAERTKLST